jgi:hypothetical protein
VLATACGKDDDAGGEGTTGDATGDTGTMTGGMSLTGQMTVDDTTGAGMTMGQTGDETDAGETTTGGPAAVFLGGEVRDFYPLAAVPLIAGAEISVWNTPGFETTSDAMALWMTGPFAPNQDVVFIVEPSTEYLGSVIPVAVGETDKDNVDLAQLSIEFVMAQYDLILDMGAIEPDLEQSIIVTRLINTQALGEGTVQVTMNPPAVADTFYAPDDAGSPVLNSNEMTFQFLPVVVYYNLPESQPGDITFEFSHPERECETVFTEYPTFGGHITLVDVECLPPM